MDCWTIGLSRKGATSVGPFVHLSISPLVRDFSAQPSADEQRLPGHPPGIARGEENGRRRDILRLTDAPERGLRFDLLAEIARDDVLRALSFDHAGIDRVHADFARPEFLGENTRERVDG